MTTRQRRSSSLIALVSGLAFVTTLGWLIRPSPVPGVPMPTEQAAHGDGGIADARGEMSREPAADAEKAIDATGPVDQVTELPGRALTPEEQARAREKYEKLNRSKVRQYASQSQSADPADLMNASALLADIESNAALLAAIDSGLARITDELPPRRLGDLTVANMLGFAGRGTFLAIPSHQNAAETASRQQALQWRDLIEAEARAAWNARPYAERKAIAEAAEAAQAELSELAGRLPALHDRDPHTDPVLRSLQDEMSRLSEIAGRKPARLNASYEAVPGNSRLCER